MLSQLIDSCDAVLHDMLDAFPAEGTSVPRVSAASSCDLTPSLVRMRAAVDTFLQVSGMRQLGDWGSMLGFGSLGGLVGVRHACRR